MFRTNKHQVTEAPQEVVTKVQSQIQQRVEEERGLLDILSWAWGKVQTLGQDVLDLATSGFAVLKYDLYFKLTVG